MGKKAVINGTYSKRDTGKELTDGKLTILSLLPPVSPAIHPLYCSVHSYGYIIQSLYVIPEPNLESQPLLFLNVEPSLPHMKLTGLCLISPGLGTPAIIGNFKYTEVERKV